MIVPADEREAIERVLSAVKPQDCPRSPITGAALDNKHLVTNRCGRSGWFRELEHPMKHVEHVHSPPAMQR